MTNAVSLDDMKAAAAEALSRLKAAQEERDAVSEEHSEVAEENSRLRSAVNSVWEKKEDVQGEVEALADKAKKVYTVTKAMEQQMEVV